MSNMIAWNSASAEAIRSNCEAAILRLISLMEGTARDYLDEADRLDIDAKAQEYIADNATHTVTKYLAYGIKTQTDEPDWKARREAAQKAASLREQERLLREEADNIELAVEKLREAIARTNGLFAYMRRALESADGHTAKLLESVNDDINAYISMIMRIHDSLRSSKPTKRTNGQTGCRTRIKLCVLHNHI